MNKGILDPKGLHDNPLTGKPYSDTYKNEAKVWSAFPTYSKGKDIISAVESKKIDVLIVISGTGSGKTVLVPKFALHALDYGKKGKVAVTLPKRVVTLSSAEFAAKTLDVELGKEIGYIYKDAPKESHSDETKMIYMTDGSLISMIAKDPLLSEYGCVVIDEAHERKVQIDLLFLLLKKIIIKRKKNPLKLIIMSATIDPTIFMRYFSDPAIGIEKMEISGVPNHPVEIIYPKNLSLDYVSSGVKIIKEILSKKTKERNDILFFVTSGNEAKKVCQKLNEEGVKDICVEVYAEMNDEQKLRLKELQEGKPKIYIATNVAESSITLSGITYVIDSGIELFASYDYSRMAKTLNKKLITKAQAMQRSGRVGRTKPGVCYRLYTESQFTSMEPYPLPEIKKSDLTSDFLKLINYVEPNKGKKNSFEALTVLLNELIDPPSTDVVDNIYKVFKTLKIIDSKDNLTMLGINISHFNSLPIGVGVSLLLSYDYNCAFDFSLLVSLMEAFEYNLSNIFHFRDKENENTLKKFGDESGDHITLLKLYKTFEAEEDKEAFCKKNKLKMKVFMSKKIEDVARKLFRKLKEINEIKKGGTIVGVKKTIDVDAILKCLAIGMQMNIVKKTDKGYRTIYPTIESRPKIAKGSSINKGDVLIYQELFIMNNVPEIHFVSSISQELLKSLDKK